MNVKLYIRRFFAFLIDWWLVFLGFMLFVFLSCEGNWEYFSMPSASMMKSPWFLVGIVWLLLFPLFRDCIFCGASIGKLIFGLKVVDKTTLGKVSFAKLILRNLTFCIIGIEGILVLANQGVRLGDMISNTSVVSRK